MMPVFIQCQHLHRDVPGRGVLFEMVQHRPAQHIGKENVERYRRWMKLSGQSQGLSPAHRYQHFESLVVRQVDQHARVVRIVFNNKQDCIVRPQVCPVVLNAFNGQLHRDRRQLAGQRTCSPLRQRGRGRGWPNVGLRQIEYEVSPCRGRCATGSRRQADWPVRD